MCRKYLSLPFLIFCLLGSLAQASDDIKIGYVSGGLYEQYVKSAFAEVSIEGVKIKFVPSEGSRHQIDLLKEGKIDLAVVQNDIAYYAYEGRRGYQRFSDFSLALPLFPEYLQVLVREDSNISTFRSLFQGTVSAGPRGSGAYQNATDLFMELGFRPGVDFDQKHLDITRALKALKRGAIDGIVYTGGSVPSLPDSEELALRALELPESVMEGMSIRSSYYKHDSIPPRLISNTEPVDTVSLTAVLVASNSLAPEIVAVLAKQLSSIGDSFLLEDGEEIPLRTPQSAIEQSPVPLHEGLKNFLRDQGHLGQDFNAFLAVFTIALLITVVTITKIRLKAYDRLGNLAVQKGSFSYSLHKLIAKAGNGIIALCLYFALVIIFIEGIQYFEDDYARQLNVKNPFADKGYQNTFLWVVTFMGAGDPGDVFPNSPIGRLMASILPFIGIGAVLGLGYSTVEQQRQKRLKAKQGAAKQHLSDHVLICGWNDKAPSIIYSLTSNDAPRKRNVVVIAEIDEESPLEKYSFDPRYVSYCRGDSADHKVLERACAGSADIAVVLGGVKKRAGKNIKSVLSTLALKEMSQRNPNRSRDLMIIVELLFQENNILFKECGANHIVSSENIIDRIAAMSCISQYTVDFTMDLLTYDEHSELYALPVSELNRLRKPQKDKKPPEDLTLEVVTRELATAGINVVAAHNTEYKDNPFLDHIFTGEKFQLLHDAKDITLKNEHELLVITDDYKTIGRLLKRQKARIGTPPKSDEMVHFAHPETRKIILVGDLNRCLRLADELRDYRPVTVTIFTTNKEDQNHSNYKVVSGKFTDEQKWLEAGIMEADQITILPKPHKLTNEHLNSDGHEQDAEAMLIAKFARNYLGKNKADRCKPVIIAAEMFSTPNKQLFLDAGVDIVIPSSLLLERVITKLIYSRGSSTRFLMALLRMEDKKHLMTFDLPPALAGKTFLELTNHMPEYFQLLGVLPSELNNRKEFLNHVGDFQYHFLTTTTQADKIDYKADLDDVLVGIVNQERWLL